MFTKQKKLKAVSELVKAQRKKIRSPYLVNSKEGYPLHIRQRALELFKKGMPAKTLAFMYHVNLSTIHLWAVHAGIKVQKKANISVIDGEIWLPYIGYEGLYELSNFGRVKSLSRKSNNYTERIVTHKKSGMGYPWLRLFKNRVKEEPFIHIMVAKMFIPNPLNLPEVNHLNGNKKDYSIDNLEWSTHGDNMRHAYETGLINHGKLGDNGRAKKIASYKNNGDMVAEYSCAAEAAIILGSFPQNITHAARKGTTHKGNYWKYFE